MKNKLTILLIDNSPITSIRFIELLRDIDEVDNVFYAKDVTKGCAIFLLSTINILILNVQLAEQELKKMVEVCDAHNCKIILLSDYTHSSYIKWCKNLGILYVLDKVSEGYKLVEIIQQLHAMPDD